MGNVRIHPDCPKCHQELLRQPDQSLAIDRSREVGIELELWLCQNCEKDLLFPLSNDDGDTMLLDAPSPRHTEIGNFDDAY